MLQNMVHPQDQQLSIEEISSPLGAQLFEFCESDLFPETLQNSEVASSSNGCYEEQSSYPTQLSNISADQMNNYNTAAIENDQIKPPPSTATAAAAATTPSSNPSTPPTITTRNSTNLSIIFDDPTTQDHIENNDISASIDFTPSPSFSAQHHHYNSNNGNNGGGNNNSQDQPFNISSLNQLSLGDMVNGALHQHQHPTAHQYSNAPERWSAVAAPPPPPVVPMLGPPLPTSYEDESLPSVQPYLRLRSSQPGCSLTDPLLPPYLPSANMNAPFSADNSGFFGGNCFMLPNDISHQELDFQGDNGSLLLPADTMPRVFNCSGDLQALSSESQHLVHGGANATPLASEISSLEDPTFKVGKLSVEERKRKIHRYMKKRNERNFSKKIKYACRKTLADSRPRVRGRFAKNDELGEHARTNGSNHEDDDDEDLFSNSMPDHQRKVVKEEDDMDSSDIFAHISGVNSFKCNYPIQSWIN